MKLSRIIAVLAGAICSTSIAAEIKVCSSDSEKDTVANKGIAVISGHGEALPEDVVVRLYKWEDRHSELVATDTIGNGSFRFEIPLKEDMAVCSLIFDY